MVSVTQRKGLCIAGTAPSAEATRLTLASQGVPQTRRARGWMWLVLTHKESCCGDGSAQPPRVGQSSGEMLLSVQLAWVLREAALYLLS